MTLSLLPILLLNAFAYPATALALQETPVACAAVVEQLSKVRMELSGPQQKPCIWAASEWMLTIENRELEGFPFSPYLLGQSGYTFGGSHVYFEVIRDSEVARNLTSNAYLGHPPGVTKADLLQPGASAALSVVLHGEMVWDLDAHGRDEKVDTRFVPVFPNTGSYSVTALLRWKGATTRSNTVKLEVAKAPADSERALEGLKQLAAAGICIDVQGMYSRNPWAVLERIAEFVEKESFSVYGAQLQIGLAEALLRIEQAQTGESPPLPTGVDATLKRVKALLAPQPRSEVGLDRTLKRLREDVALEDRKAH